MGMARRKPANEETTTDERLTTARGDLARITASIVDAGRERDLALLDDNRPAVEQAEANAGALEKERERAERRISLLEEKAAAEQRARQEKAQADLIERSAANFRERDAANAEMLEHMGPLIVAFRKALAAGVAAVSGWPFNVGDHQAALVGAAYIRAISSELYRLTGSPYLGAGGVVGVGGVEFPGALCPSITDPRPEAIKPLAEQVAEATAYALRIMRESPIRPLPIAAPPQPVVAAIAPAATPAAELASQPSEPAAAEEDHLPEYAWHVDFLNTATGERKAERIVLSAQEVEETHLDGIGPLGPRGPELVMRLASARAPEGFIFDGRPESIRFDMAALRRSMGDL